MPAHAASSRTPETPAHPALSSWAINRRLKKLEENYQHDQKSKPAEIASLSIGGPEVEVISYMVKRLKQYVDEIKSVYEAEIEAGRVADTAGFWAAVYSQKILPSVKPKINSLGGSLARKLWVTGGGGPGERAAVEEAQRELSRLKVALDRELVSAHEHAEGEIAAVGDNHVSRAASNPHVAPAAGPREPVIQKATAADRPAKTSKPPSLLFPRSPWKRRIAFILIDKNTANDREVCDKLDEDGAELPRVLVTDSDRTFAAAYLDPVRRPKLQEAISKVRRMMRDRGLMRS